MANAIIFLRVSTQSQVESKNGLQAQRAACVKYCLTNELDVRAEYVDAGVSGSAELDERVGLMAAIGALQKGDVLVVAKRDRIARDVLNAAIIEKMILSKKAAMASADGMGNGDDPTSALMRNILNAFSAYERALIAMRTSAALQARKAAGKIYGKIPFGFRADLDGVHFIQDEREQAILADACSWRAEGRSWIAICDTLNAVQRFNRAGRAWSPQNLGSIVRRAA